MNVVPFELAHLDALDVQPAQRGLPMDRRASAQSLAFTGLVDGAPVACGGLYYVEGVPLAWMVIGANAGPFMLAITRALQDVLEAVPVVFAYAEDGFAAGCRWLQMLRFTPTTDTQMVDGRRHTLYRRCRE